LSGGSNCEWKYPEKPYFRPGMKGETASKFFDQIHGRKVLVVGDSMLDSYCYGEVSRISPEAPVPVLLESSREAKAGGAANVALNLIGLGLDVSLFGAWATDEAGIKLATILEESGMNQAVRFAHTCTTEKQRIIGRGQQMLRIDRERMFRWSEADLLRLQTELRGMHDIELVVVSDYNKGFISRSFMEVVRSFCAEKRIPFVSDPKVQDWSLYAGSLWLTPNLGELGLAVGIHADNVDEWVESALEKAAELVPGTSIAVTRAENGISYIQSGTFGHSKAVAREVYDVCGAGDTVLAVVAAGVLSGAANPVIFDLANRAAGHVVARQGTVAIQRSWL